MFQIAKGNILLLKGSKYYFSPFYLKMKKVNPYSSTFPLTLSADLK